MRPVYFNPENINEDTVPVSIYRFLPRGSEDPLPETHFGKIYHYTSADSVLKIADSNQMLASHIDAMNDPSERKYGWRSISRRFEATRSEFSEFAASQFDEIFNISGEETWLPQIFLLSASRSRDNLTQYRMYGQMCIEIKAGMWVHHADEEEWSPNTRLSSWRPVIYGKKAAEQYISNALRSVADIMDAAPRDDRYEDTSLTVLLILQMASLYIKHPAYKPEKEVRLVFAVHEWGDSLPLARAAGDRVIAYVRSRVAESDPDISADEQQRDESLIRSVTVGPLGGGKVSQRGLKAHFERRFPKDRVQIDVSSKPYTG